jgi:hypothetical protein
MMRLWKLIEEHYFLAAWIVVVLIGQISKIILSFIRIFHRPDIHNHLGPNEGETETAQRTQPPERSRLGSGITIATTPVQRSTGLTRAERIIRNLTGGNS